MAKPKLLVATRNPGKLREYCQLLRDLPFELVSLDELGIGEEVEETGRTFAENAALKARTYGALGGLLTLADDSGLEVDALGGAPGIFSSRYGEISPHPPGGEVELPGDSSSIAQSGGNRDSTQGSGGMSDQDRVNLLLRNLEGVPWERRTARFRCVLAIAVPPSPGLLRPAPPSPPYQRTEEALPFQDHNAHNKGAENRGDLSLVVGSVAGMIQYESRGDEGFGYDPVFFLPSYGLTMAQLPLEEKNRISHRANAVGKAVRLLKGTE